LNLFLLEIDKRFEKVKKILKCYTFIFDMSKYFESLSRKEKTLILIWLGGLIVFNVLNFFFVLPVFIEMSVVFLSLLTVGSFSGFLVGSKLVNLVKIKLKVRKAIRGGKEFRLLEYSFFIFIFLATLFLTYAMHYFSYKTIVEQICYIIYWTITTFFYSLALMVGKAHYIDGVYGFIK